MSNMQYEQISYAGNVQILKRLPNEAIPMTLDFTDVVEKTADGKGWHTNRKKWKGRQHGNGRRHFEIRCYRRQTAGCAFKESIYK